MDRHQNGLLPKRHLWWIGSHWCPVGYQEESNGGRACPRSLQISQQRVEPSWTMEGNPRWVSLRVHVAFAGSQDYRVWGHALCKDPISTFFPSATPKSLIVWPQTKYFETTPSQPGFSEPGCFIWAWTRVWVEMGWVACSRSPGEGMKMGLFGNLKQGTRQTIL